MQHHYTRLRNKIFKPSTESNMYIVHIGMLIMLIISPLLLEGLQASHKVFTLVMIGFVLFSVFLPVKLYFIFVFEGLVAAFLLVIFVGQQYDITSWQYLIKMIFVGIFTVQLMFILIMEILHSEISLKLVYQCIDGYLLLGICFGFLFRVVHFFDAGSFNFNSGSEFDHFYLSIITLTTVGMGDVLPVNAPAKHLLMLNGISGQIYLTFFAAMIVGKYITSQKSGSNKME